MKITHYEVCANGLLQDLEKNVRLFMNDGWEPFGAPFKTEDYYCQAMVKYEIEKENKDQDKNEKLIEEVKWLNEKLATWNVAAVEYDKDMTKKNYDMAIHKDIIKELIERNAKYNQKEGYWIILEGDEYSSKSHENHPEEILNEILEHRARLRKMYEAANSN